MIRTKDIFMEVRKIMRLRKEKLEKEQYIRRLQNL